MLAPRKRIAAIRTLEHIQGGAAVADALADLEEYWSDVFPDVFGGDFVPLQGGYFSVDPGNIDPTLYPQGGLSATNTLRVGDSLPSLSGVMDFRFSNYRIQPVGPIDFTESNPRPAAPARAQARRVWVGRSAVCRGGAGGRQPPSG